MAVCTFFGHRDCPDSVQPELRHVLIDLIEESNVNFFYIGTQGRFDSMVLNVVRSLQYVYPNIDYAVVLAYMPNNRDEYYKNSCYPEGLESIPPKYAINWRNKWMLKQSEYVVTYITHSWGGAAKFSELAKRQGKVVINICDQ